MKRQGTIINFFKKLKGSGKSQPEPEKHDNGGSEGNTNTGSLPAETEKNPSGSQNDGKGAGKNDMNVSVGEGFPRGEGAGLSLKSVDMKHLQHDHGMDQSLLREPSPVPISDNESGNDIDNESDKDSDTNNKSEDNPNDHPNNDVVPVSLEKQWPTDWGEKQIKEFREKYEWLDAENGLLGCLRCAKVKKLGALANEQIAIAVEWAEYTVGLAGVGGNREKRLRTLQKKKFKHVRSEAHISAEKIYNTGEKKSLEQAVEKQANFNDATTAKIFRSVYQLAKLNRPFSDLPHLVELQQINGLNMGVILHSRYSATRIVEVIAVDMKRRIVQALINNASKLSVLVDEAVNISKKATLVINIQGAVDSSEPMPIFLELVELNGQDAKSISEAIVKCLKNSGFSEEYLQAHWIGFVSDGANVMLGKKGGVFARLRKLYPRLVPWHCVNHRLELAVADSVKSVTPINHFKSFLEEVHNVYSYSAKNMTEISDISQSLSMQILSIGRILSVRWVASSFRTVHGVWTNYKALYTHFSTAADDLKRSSSEPAKFSGLARRLNSPEFVLDLGLMYDALQELSNLSIKLQARSVTLLQSTDLIKRSIRLLESLKSLPGEKYEEALKGESEGKFYDVGLLKNAKLVSINKEQFLQSLVDNMRLLDEGKDADSVFSDMRVLDTTTWPENPGIRHGEKEIKRLCERFNFDLLETLDGMREFVDKNGKGDVPLSLKPLVRCINTLPCGTAEFERTFSLMNTIASDLRARLTISNISNLMMININGPPLNIWNPGPYIKTWRNASHRTADDPRSRRCELNKSSGRAEKDSLWKIL